MLPARTPAAAVAGAGTSLHHHLCTLATEVDATRRDSGFHAALDAMARFWQYSLHNQELIRDAFPSATRVASAKVWAKLGRTPLPGARPIMILAPTATGFPFLLVPVLDISQTEGPPVPALDLMLTGTDAPVQRLEHAAAALGIRVDVLNTLRPVLGVSRGGEVKIRAGLAAEAHVSVLAHELAHEMLHTAERARKRGPRRTHAEVETEAEATAYVVLRVLGLSSKAPTYIAWRGGDGAAVLRSMRRILRAARAILTAAGLGERAGRGGRRRRLATKAAVVRF